MSQLYWRLALGFDEFAQVTVFSLIRDTLLHPRGKERTRLQRKVDPVVGPHYESVAGIYSRESAFRPDKKASEVVQVSQVQDAPDGQLTQSLMTTKPCRESFHLQREPSQN